MNPNKLLFSFKTLKLITFDVTGTLLQFKRLPVDIYMEIGCKHGVVVKDRESMVKAFKKNFQFLTKTEPHFGNGSSGSWYNWWRTFVFRTFEDSGIGAAQLSPQKLNAISQELIKLFTTNEVWKVSDSGFHLLNEIKSQNPTIYTGIISNFDSRLHEILKATNILEYFDFVLTSHQCQISKPDSRIFQIAYNLGQNLIGNSKQKLQPSEILHVGDNYDLDCVTPKSMGWNVCLIGKDKGDTTDQAPVFPNLDSLLTQLKS